MTLNNRSILEKPVYRGRAAAYRLAMKTNTIPLYERNNYGNTALYATGPLAEPIARLTGRKTLTRHDLEALRQLGFEFALQQDPKGALATYGLRRAA